MDIISTHNDSIDLFPLSCVMFVMCFFKFCSKNIRKEEVFIGYNKDTAAGVILKAWEICTGNMGVADDSAFKEVES